MRNVVVADFVRSPFTPANRGELAKVRPDDLAGQVVKALVERLRLAPDGIEDLLMGCAFPEAEQGLNVARLVGFLAGLPQSTAGATVNRFCGSSMQSVHMAAGAIALNAGDAFICAGLESMSRVPMTGFNPMPHPGLYQRYPQAYVGMGVTAENVARKYSIARAEQEAMAVESHAKAAAARAAGKFAHELIAIRDGNRAIEADGCIRPDTTAATLAGLEPAFEKAGTVTAGTSSPLTDGAVALLVCAEEHADRLQLPKLARVRSVAVAGCAPELMGMGPVYASQKALKRAGLTIQDIDIVELNEAFAAQAIACLRELGLDSAKVNLDGGALALGHPLGATGARIVGKAAQLLQREGKRYALATQCIGGGQGIATVLEACQ
ncbi:MAG: thiolase family protein [Alphaproteobacteria bacterium]|nr:thiolase family protein [Alphaproteobacteria bacterium]